MRLTGGAGLRSLCGFQSGETFENPEKIVSVSMERPHFPSLQPKMADQQWFHIDKPCDEESELTQLEKEHQNAVSMIVIVDSTLLRLKVCCAVRCASEAHTHILPLHDSLVTNHNAD